MDIVKCECIVDGANGQYIPQIFAERFPEWLDDDDKAILLAGPEYADYWEAWETVLDSEHNRQFLTYSEGGNDLMLCEESPMQLAVSAFADGEGLEDCPDIIRHTVTVLCNEFLTDPEGWQSEEDALSWFSPDSHDDELANAALAWLNTRLKEEVQS